MWAAVNEHRPWSARQRCTNHQTMNLVDKFPLKEWPEYTKRLRAPWQVDSDSGPEAEGSYRVMEPGGRPAELPQELTPPPRRNDLACSRPILLLGCLPTSGSTGASLVRKILFDLLSGWRFA